ncbi:MAG: apocytochrome f [Cyanobacteria bacterium P01_F01_bin.33]
MKRFLLAAIACTALLFASAGQAFAFPAYAQAAYDNPREATGKIVCANCHLNSMPTKLEVPQSVIPGQVFDAVVQIPYDTSVQQVLGDGSRGGLNVGAVVVLPEGFRLATEDEMTEKQREETAETYIQPYSEDNPNMFVVGPIAGEDNQEIIFPVKAPDPKEDSRVAFMKYLVFVGGNRGRGQLNPDGTLSNNNAFTASADGTIVDVLNLEDPSELSPDSPVASLVDLSQYYAPVSIVSIEQPDGSLAADVIPAGPTVSVSTGDVVIKGQALTDNPNVGGFGQTERELVLQSPSRIVGLIGFLAIVSFAQIMLVVKKKQIEKIQVAEGFM